MAARDGRLEQSADLDPGGNIRALLMQQRTDRLRALQYAAFIEFDAGDGILLCGSPISAGEVFGRTARDAPEFLVVLPEVFGNQRSRGRRAAGAAERAGRSGSYRLFPRRHAGFHLEWDRSCTGVSSSLKCPREDLHNRNFTL